MCNRQRYVSAEEAQNTPDTFMQCREVRLNTAHLNPSSTIIIDIAKAVSTASKQLIGFKDVKDASFMAGYANYFQTNLFRTNPRKSNLIGVVRQKPTSVL